MARNHTRSGRRRLLVTADDFGRSRDVNRAVAQAHAEGILTTASLMVNGGAFDDAVEFALANPTLGVGLHLALAAARSTLKPTEVPDLVDARYNLRSSAVHAGLRYFFRRDIRWQLRHEIQAQVDKYRTTGLKLGHVDGHLHLHLHPTVLSLISHHARSWGITHMRLTRDRFWLDARLSNGRLAYRLSHAIVFTLLSLYARPALQKLAIKHADTVFGLLRSGRVDAEYLLKLLPRLPPGDSELYCHPSCNESPDELQALTSPRVREMVATQGISLIRYQDL